MRISFILTAQPLSRQLWLSVYRVPAALSLRPTIQEKSYFAQTRKCIEYYEITPIGLEILMSERRDDDVGSVDIRALLWRGAGSVGVGVREGIRRPTSGCF